MERLKRTVGAAAAWMTSPSKRQVAEPAAASVEVPRISGVPRDWIGVKCGAVFKATHSFPCIGTACAAGSVFHPIGSRAQGFRDYSDAHFGKNTEWQHMCEACASQHSEVQAWQVRYDARRRRALDASAVDREAECERLEDDAIEQALAAKDAQALMEQPMLASATEAAVTVEGATEAAEAAPEVAEAAPAEPLAETPVAQPVAQPASQPPRFIGHKEQRMDLGKPLWAAVAPHIPRVGHDGRLHMPQAGCAVDLKALRRLFPALPFIKPEPAAARAAHLLHSSPDCSWTHELMEQARNCFECEAVSIELAVVMPEVIAREELMEDERYQVREQGHVIGCKLFCPGCKSNEHVLLGDVNLDHDNSVRFAYGNGRAILPASRAYICCNPACPDVLAKVDDVSIQLLRAWTADGILGSSAKGKVTEIKKLGAQFFGHDARVMLALPRRVRALYRGLLCWKQGGCDDEFAEKMLTSTARLAELEADLQVTARARERKALQDYLAFVRLQRGVARPAAERFFGVVPSPRTKWPGWRLQQMSDSLLHASAHNIRVTLIEYHRLLKPILLGDMIRRSPGRGMSMDGTFRLMNRTKTDGNVLVLFIGTDGCIVTYYVLKSESWKEMSLGLQLFNRRLERLGTVEELEECWSDRCCDGANDPSKHPVVTLFPKSRLKRAPRKDRFHAINGVNKTGNEGVPEQKAQLGADLFDALCEIPDTEYVPVMRYLQRKDPRLDDLAARVKARAEYRHDGIIRTRSRRRDEQLRRWRRARHDWQVRARRDKERGERSVIRPKVGKLQGTLEEMECMESCIEKGCMEDPWPIEEMWLDTKVQPITGLQERIKCGETNRNEACHRVLNEIVAGVARLGEDLAEVLLDFMIYFINRRKDVILGRVDAHSLSLFPWDDVALGAEAAELLDGPPLFPASLAPRHELPPVEPINASMITLWEPLGFEYPRFLMQQQTAEAAAAVVAGAAAAQEEAALEEEAREEVQLGSPMVQHKASTRAAERAADLTAAALTAAAYTTSATTLAPAATGGSHWSGACKNRARTIANSTPVKPARHGELRVMVEALREARAAHPPNSATMYEAARAGYLQRVEMAYADRSVAPNAADLRPAPTTAALLKEVAEGNLRYAMRIEQERERGGASSDPPILALPAPDAIAVHLASPTANPTFLTGDTSPAASTGQTQPAQLARFDFSLMLPAMSAKEKKALREKGKYQEKMTMAVTVSRSELDTLNTQVLYRVARQLGVNVKRKTGGRGWDEIRSDVQDAWPDAQDSLELKAC